MLAQAVLGSAGFLFIGCEPAGSFHSAGTGINEPHRQLVELLRDRRILRSRLVGGFEHVACRPEPTGTATAFMANCSEFVAANSDDSVMRLGREIAQELVANKSGPSLHASGVWLLLQRPNGDSLDRAIGRLREAVGQSPVVASRLNDLGAALYHRALLTGDPGDLLEALEILDSAMDGVKIPIEVPFNRAMVLERLRLTHLAEVAWRAYLEQEPSPRWRMEGQHHLDNIRFRRAEIRANRDQLRTALANHDRESVALWVGRFPEVSSDYAEEVLLPAWARSSLAGRDQEAHEILGSLELLTATLAEHGFDLLVNRAVENIRLLHSRDQVTKLEDLARGHIAYGEARGLYTKHDIGAALESFLTSGRFFGRANSPFKTLSVFYQWVCRYQSGELVAALEGFETLAREVRADSYLKLRCRLNWMIGMARLATGQPVASLRSYREALAESDELASWEDKAALHSLIAANLVYLGSDREAWEHQYRALELTEHVTDSRRLHAIYEEGGRALLKQGRPEIATLFRAEAVAAARSLKDPVSLCHALLRRSEALIQAGREQAAERDLNESEQFVARIPDPRMQLRVSADLARIRAQLAGRSPREALQDLTQALTFYRELGDAYRVPNLLVGRSRAYIRLGQLEQGEEDLRLALEGYESQRRQVTSEVQRASYLHRRRIAFHEMVALQAMVHGRHELAFEFSERVRARVLWDHVSGAGRPTLPNLTVRELQQSLRTNETLVEYLWLPEKLLAWVIDSQSFKFLELSDEPQAVATLVDELLAGITSGISEAALVSPQENLFEILLAPVVSELHPASNLVIVPDHLLHALPFTALRDFRTGRLVVEDWRVTVQPSASIYFQALRRARSITGAVRREILVVGNPATPQDLDLPPLPSAERGATRIAELYPVARLISGTEATKRRVLGLMDEFPIVHYAGHAVVNLSFPRLSFIALAEKPGDTAELFAHEIERLRLPDSRIVVLAACQTAGGASDRSLEPFGLAEAFLAAGSLTVVASLWPVEDAATGELFHTFHTHLLAGLGPAEALRRAQLRLLASDDRRSRLPTNWAGFVVLGLGE